MAAISKFKMAATLLDMQFSKREEEEEEEEEEETLFVNGMHNNIA